MKNLGEAFVLLWENLSGIQVTEKSKILKLIFFTVLIIGSAWAVMNYNKSEQLSDLSTLEVSGVSRRSKNDPTIEKIIERVQSVNKMRSEGNILAGSMTAMNRRLFNTDAGVDITGSGGELNLAADPNLSVPDISMPQQITPPDVQVKAVMTTGKNRLAVINTPGSTGLIVRRGSRLPGDSGRITAITRDSVTLRFANQNFVYSIGGQGAKDGTKANNNNDPSRKSLRENMQSRYDIQDLYRTAK